MVFTPLLRYQQCFIPLPVDGSLINNELAKTFNPNHSGSNAANRGASLTLLGQTRYAEEFGSAAWQAGVHRAQSFKSRMEMHINPDDKLLFKKSITHETFHSHPIPQRSQLHKPIAQPPSVVGNHRFNGRTRYADEYIDLSKNGYRVDLAKGRDDSNRVNGNSIPNRARDYMFDNGLDRIGASELEAVMRSNQPSAHKPVENSNPYLSDYLD